MGALCSDERQPPLKSAKHQRLQSDRCKATRPLDESSERCITASLNSSSGLIKTGLVAIVDAAKIELPIALIA